MSEYLARITSKGQVTLPKKLREELRLSVGDYILFRSKEGKLEGEKLILSREERFERLAKDVEARFKELGLTKADIQEAIRWARKSS